MIDEILQGDALKRLRKFPSGSVHACVTSPPYFGLRDYGMAGQIGLEITPKAYVAKLVKIFREVRRVLRDDGTLWLNLGDSYAGSWGNYGGKNRGAGTQRIIRKGSMVHQQAYDPLTKWKPPTASKGLGNGIKPKDLIGIPWRVALALQADGWYLRQDIIWHKPNPMPESVADRCTKSHEYIFMLAKSPRYYYDAEAIKEPAKYFDIKGMDRTGFKDATKFAGKHSDKQRGHSRRHAGFNERWDDMERRQQGSGMRNKRDVWTVATRPYKEAHFATFPPNLIEPCILAGVPPAGVVLDPFLGSGTTAVVARNSGRHYLGIELNPAYIEIAQKRLAAMR